MDEEKAAVVEEMRSFMAQKAWMKGSRPVGRGSSAIEEDATKMQMMQVMNRMHR